VSCKLCFWNPWISFTFTKKSPLKKNYIISAFDLKHQGIQVSRHPGIKASKHQGFQASRHPTSRHPTSRHPTSRRHPVLGHPALRHPALRHPTSTRRHPKWCVRGEQDLSCGRVFPQTVSNKRKCSIGRRFALYWWLPSSLSGTERGAPSREVNDC